QVATAAAQQPRVLDALDALAGVADLAPAPHARKDFAGDELELLEAPVERVEDDVVHAAVEGGDARADALGDLGGGAEQVVRLPVVEIHAGVDLEARRRRLRRLARLQHPDEVRIDAPDATRIAPVLAREGLHLGPVAL